MHSAQNLATELTETSYPHYIKYMGSKSKIISFVLEGINEVHKGGAICDLFAGSASLSGAIGNQTCIYSNDIQNYSAVLANTYLNAYRFEGMPSSEEVLAAAKRIVDTNKDIFSFDIDYQKKRSIEEFTEIEKQQLNLINHPFQHDWHLFVKFYSGTWWSAEQCLWIDALRQVIEQYKTLPCYNLYLSALMYAMAYTSQGTGHYAQYRDANTESSMADILIYRKRSISTYFEKKLAEVTPKLRVEPPQFNHHITSLDFKDCLTHFEGGTVYADPPYCFVHYSRFYHALETLVLYDYPSIQTKNGQYVKGRYREDRHQSPFSIRTKVKDAFELLFTGIRNSGSNLVLSYSNTGLISIDEIGALAKNTLSDKSIEILTTDHQHMTLGRKNDRHREVEECLILIK